jgi:hypothetical protein
MSSSPVSGIFTPIVPPSAILVPALKIFRVVYPPIPFIENLTNMLTFWTRTNFLIRMVFIRGKLFLTYFAYHILNRG